MNKDNMILHDLISSRINAGSTDYNVV